MTQWNKLKLLQISFIMILKEYDTFADILPKVYPGFLY